MPIVVAGHTGLVGSAIFEELKSRGEDVIGIDSKVVNLLDRENTFKFIGDIKPSAVIDAAAVVGGIGANNSYPVDFLSKNLQIQTNLMDASHEADVAKFVFLGSSCIYPKECLQPIKEDYLMTGPLEPTNSAYAIAKIAGIELIKSYRKQYNRRWISIMPTNMYGPRDNFSIENGHVLPALINKFVSAAQQNASKVTLWGSGHPRREFLHSRDLAQAALFLMENYDEDSHINVGVGEDVSIAELADLISQKVGYQGEIAWDTSKPDGTPQKLLDISKLKAAGWSAQVTLDEGLSETIHWFKKNVSTVRV